MTRYPPERPMSVPDPLAHLPDPGGRYQVLGLARGPLLWVEVYDQELRQGLTLDLLSALRVASAITAEAARLLEELGQAAPEADGPLDADALDAALERHLWRRPDAN